MVNLVGYAKKVESGISSVLDKSVSSVKKIGETKKKKGFSVKSILKKSQASVTIPDYKAPSVLGDTNRFFKGEMEETKGSMFFE
jgi:hypothetical protein